MIRRTGIGIQWLSLLAALGLTGCGSSTTSPAADLGRGTPAVSQLQPLDLATTLTVGGSPWGKSTCYIGGDEGNTRFDVNDLKDLGVNTFRIYGGVTRWETQDDSGGYGTPSINDIKANPNAIDWTRWDAAMTSPPAGSDYSWSKSTAVWQGNARSIFSQLKAAGIKPVVVLRNQDNFRTPLWIANPPKTTADWNEWWEHVFATIYWLNVRNDYHVDDWEIHNEPDNASQGWGGSLADYYTFAQYTNDAIQYVYKTYLPGRTPHVLAAGTVGGSTWPQGLLANAGTSFDSMDIHNYDADVSGYDRTVHGWMNAAGRASMPLWVSEWGTYTGGYDSLPFTTTLLSNLIRMSQPGDDYVYGSHLFSLFDWSGSAEPFQGLIDASGTKRLSYYALRMGIRALQGCRTTFQTTSNTSDLKAITTREAGGNLDVLVTNTSQTAGYTADVNLQNLVSDGVGTLWRNDATHQDTLSDNPTLVNGHTTVNVPANGSVLLSVTSINRLSNPGFETGTAASWQLSANASVVNHDARSGGFAARIAGSPGGVYLLLSGLAPYTSYTLRGNLKSTSQGNLAYLYAKNFGGGEVRSSDVTRTTYTPRLVTFTTGNTTTAEIGIWRDSPGGGGDVYADDLELSALPNLLSNSGFESGSLAPWQTQGGMVTTSAPLSGLYAAQIGGSSAGIYLNLTGLLPSTTYTFRGYLKSGSPTDSAYLYAKNTGATGGQTSASITTDYNLATVSFTTGPSNTTAEVGVWRDPGSGTGVVSADAFELLKPVSQSQP